MTRSFVTIAWWRFAGVAFVVSLLPGYSRAEVGVVLDATTARGPYLHAIVDDPVPVGGIWARMSTTQSSSRFILNPLGAVNGDGNPDFIFNPVSNLPIVVWSKNNAGIYEIVLSYFAAGAWSTPQVVIESAGNQFDPSLVVDATGAVHIFFWVDTGVTQRVYYTHAPADLSSWSTAIPVSGLAEAACRPGASIHNGTLVVAYEVHPSGFGTTPRQVVAAKYQGGDFVSEVVAVSNNAEELWPAAQSHAGRYWVEWVDSACGISCPGEVGWRRWDTNSNDWSAIQLDPFATVGDRDFHVRPGIRLEAIAP